MKINKLNLPVHAFNNSRKYIIYSSQVYKICENLCENWRVGCQGLTNDLGKKKKKNNQQNQ